MSDFQLAVLCWLASAVLVSVCVYWLTWNWDGESESSRKGIARNLSRSFLVAYWFSPTLVLAGWWAFPMPASLVIMFFWLTPPDKLRHVDRMNHQVGIVMFVVVWFIASLTGYFLARRRSCKISEQTGEPTQT